MVYIYLKFYTMREWLFDNIFTILTSLLGSTSLVGWILERNKRKIEEKQATSDALKSMQHAYDEFTKDALEKYKELREEVNALRDELTKERLKNFQLEVEIKELKQKMKGSQTTK